MRAYSRWALIQGWALIKFLCLQDGRLFKVDANSRLGAYSNKYGNLKNICFKYNNTKIIIGTKIHFAFILCKFSF